MMSSSALGYSSARYEPNPLKIPEAKNPSGNPRTSSISFAPAGIRVYRKIKIALQMEYTTKVPRRPSQSFT